MKASRFSIVVRNLGVWMLWALTIGFALGVFVRSMVVVPGAAIIGLLLGAFLMLVVSAPNTYRLRAALVGMIAVIAFGVGVYRMESAALVADPVLLEHVGQKIEIEGIVSDEPDNRATQVRVPIRVQTAASSTAQGIVLAIFPAHTDVYYGERIRVSGTLQTPQSFDAAGGRQFNYPGFLAVQGIQFELDRARLVSGEGFSGNKFVAFSYFLKESFVSGLQMSLPEPQSGLAGGITVGDKRALGKDITAEFQTVSLVHIVVLSGYNITIIISALFWLLAASPRFIRFGTGGFVALFFAVMTGFASASLRAALMAMISITGTLTGRVYKPERALALVAAGMIFWNPYILVFDPGFQLSFLATGGLLAFTPLLSYYFQKIPDTAKVREILISTVGAQVAVLPLLLYQSGNLSLVSIPANLLVLFAVPPAMLASVIAALGGLFFVPLAPLVGFPAYILLSYVLGVAHMLASIPYAAVTVPSFSAWWLLPVYAVLAAVVIVQGSKTEIKKAAPEARLF